MFARREAELVVRLLVLFLHEQGPGEFKPNAQQPGIPIKNPPECELGTSVVARRIGIHSSGEFLLGPSVKLDGGDFLRSRGGEVRAETQQRDKQAEWTQPLHEHTANPLVRRLLLLT